MVRKHYGDPLSGCKGPRKDCYPRGKEVSPLPFQSAVRLVQEMNDLEMQLWDNCTL